MTWTGSFEFLAPARIIFGLGSAKRLGDIARQLERTAPLILTDPGLHRLGITESVETSLREAGLRVATSTDVTTEPTLAAIKAAADAYRAHEADLLVAVGGGSTLDSSKAVSLVLGNPGELRDYQERRVGNEWIPAKKVERRGADLITVPTTAGTGSEVTEWAGVFDPETGIKGWAGDAKLRASVVVDDPELTISVPARVTADTGLDALSQAIETYLCHGFKPLVDTIALKAIGTMGQFLPRAFANGHDIEARAAMLGAATMTGMVFPNGGLIHVHTFAEVLGDITHLPHGRLIGLMLPHVLDWSLIGCQPKLAEIASVLGVARDRATVRANAEAAVEAIRRLCHDLEVNEPLRSHGMSETDVRTVAERVFAQHAPRSRGGPRGFRSVDEVQSVLSRAY
jgi:choline dehydrogenase